MGGKSDGPEKPEPTEQERALAERGAQRFNRFVRSFKPVVKDSARARRTTQSDLSTVRSGASAEAAQQATPISELASGGANTGAVAAQVASESDAQAGATGAGVANARPQLLQRETEGLLSAVQQGRQLSGRSSQGLADIGQSATQQAIQMEELERQNDTAMRRGLISAGATIAGREAQRRGLDLAGPSMPANGSRRG